MPKQEEPKGATPKQSKRAPLVKSFTVNEKRLTKQAEDELSDLRNAGERMEAGRKYGLDLMTSLYQNTVGCNISSASLDRPVEQFDNTHFFKVAVDNYWNYFNNCIIPKRTALKFSTKDLVNTPREKLEKIVGQTTTHQCRSTIGNHMPLNSIGTDIQKYCWLCGFPLYIVKDKKGKKKAPQCEHKLAMLIMMIIGAGLKRKPAKGKGMVPDSSEFKKLGHHLRAYEAKLWKTFVRYEGYAWSHAYCNMFKSQMPFISLRKVTDVPRRHADSSSADKFEYFIEINNIIQFVSALFDLNQDNIKDVWGVRPYKIPENWSEMFQNLQREGLKDLWLDAIKKYIAENSLPNTLDSDDGKMYYAKTAYNIIIENLLPTYYLLNIGSDTTQYMKFVTEQYWEALDKKGRRTFYNKMSEFPIKNRLIDNLDRIVGYVSKYDIKKNSAAKSWSDWLHNWIGQGGCDGLLTAFYDPTVVTPGGDELLNLFDSIKNIPEDIQETDTDDMAPDSELLYLDRHKDQEQVRRKREGANVRPSSEFQAQLADEARRRTGGPSGFGIMTKGHKPRGRSGKKGGNTGGRKIKKKRRTKRKKRKRKKKTRRKKRKRTRRRKRS